MAKFATASDTAPVLHHQPPLRHKHPVFSLPTILTQSPSSDKPTIAQIVNESEILDATHTERNFHPSATTTSNAK
jgi:hypothetical protein